MKVKMIVKGIILTGEIDWNGRTATVLESIRPSIELTEVNGQAGSSLYIRISDISAVGKLTDAEAQLSGMGWMYGGRKFEDEE